MQTRTPIQPVGAGTGIATQIQLVASIIDLADQTASTTFALLDAGDNTVGLGRWFMDTGTYAQWGGDDGYAISATISGRGLGPAYRGASLGLYLGVMSKKRGSRKRPTLESDASQSPRKARDTSTFVSQRTKIDWTLAIRERDDLTDRQKDILALIEDRDTKVVFLSGPAGSAKSFLGVLAGLRLLNRGTISDILYVRSIIESGSKSLGSLPGGADEKLQPFVMPLMDKLEELLPKGDIVRLAKEERFQGIPVNYLRGASWNARFVLADEAQNDSFAELTTIMTRLGRFSKLVIAGDPLQSDLNGKSGFMKMFDLFNDESSRAEGIHCVSLTKEDVVRSGILRYLLERIEGYVASGVAR